MPGMTRITEMSRIKDDCNKWDASDVKSSVLENPQLHLVSQH